MVFTSSNRKRTSTPCLSLSPGVALSPCLSPFSHSAAERIHFGRADGKAKVVLICALSATYTFKGDKQILWSRLRPPCSTQSYINISLSCNEYLWHSSAEICLWNVNLSFRIAFLCLPLLLPSHLHSTDNFFYHSFSFSNIYLWLNREFQRGIYLKSRCIQPVQQFSSMVLKSFTEH